MKKRELKTGMIVKTRKGELALVVLDNCYQSDALIFNNESWTPLEKFSENLIWYECDEDRLDFCKSVDIVAVFKPSLPTGFLNRTKLILLWERNIE